MHSVDLEHGIFVVIYNFESSLLVNTSFEDDKCPRNGNKESE